MDRFTTDFSASADPFVALKGFLQMAHTLLWLDEVVRYSPFLCLSFSLLKSGELGGRENRQLSNTSVKPRRLSQFGVTQVADELLFYRISGTAHEHAFPSMPS